MRRKLIRPPTPAQRERTHAALLEKAAVHTTNILADLLGALDSGDRMKISKARAAAEAQHRAMVFFSLTGRYS